MSAIQQLLTDHIGIWTGADAAKRTGRGRASGNAGSVYGVKKLRELILELAVRGKLVPQDVNDEPASELLKRIQAEKEKLVKAGMIKKDKPLAEIADEEKPFELPRGWVCTRLQDTFDVRDGTHDTPKYCESGFPLVTSKNLYTGVLDLSDIKYISKEDHLKIKDRSRVDRKDILFAMIGSIGNPVIVETDIEFSIKNVALFKPYSHQLCNMNYLLKYLLIAAVKMREEAAGAVQSFVSLGIIRNYIFLMPPLAEQHRIVAKVDELMALCDQLEAQHNNAAEAHEKIVSVLLQALTQSVDANVFADNWQRIAAHFDTLFTTEASIDALKQTLLQLAVMGKLVPQDANDEPASALLQKIRAEKDKLIKEGKIKKDKPLPEISEEEKPFELSSGWEWVRLSQLTTHLGDGLHGTPQYTSNEKYYFVNGNNLKDGKIVLKSETKTVDKKEYEKHKKPLGSNCVLVSINGTLGSVAFYNGEPIILGKSACYFNLASSISKDFIRCLIEAPGFLSYAIKSATGSTIKNLGLKAMNDLPIALPPLTEQHRIVAKVDELMALCEQLKARIGEAGRLQQKIADVVVEGVVA